MENKQGIIYRLRRQYHWTVSMTILITGFLLFSGMSTTATAMDSFNALSYSWDSRSDTGVPDDASGTVIYTETIDIPGGVWMRLQFGEGFLGENSFIRIVSLQNQGNQVLNTESLSHYRNRSAFFNGGNLTVELVADPSDNGVFITIDKIYFKSYEEPGPGVESICGGTDDRVVATDPAIGRFIYFDVTNNMIAKCTVWISSGGAYLSAGHCFSRSDVGDPDLLEFNVPLSNPNGNPNFSDPDDQYPVDIASVIRVEDGTGNDYSVFDCNPNSNTGLLPVQGQNDFYRPAKISDIHSPATIRITGYGIDNGILNRTLQTHTGPYLTENTWSSSQVSVEYQVDTRSGNSGGPVIINGTKTAIGIHTHAGCNLDENQGNHGTSFGNNNLASALTNFFGPNVTYVDVAHPVFTAPENGTVFKPFDTVLEGITHAVTGSEIRIVQGGYPKSDGNTFTVGEDGKSLLLTTPAGVVTIGH